MINIWLDDERVAPHNYVWLTTPEMCIETLILAKAQNIHIGIMSLDHDLGLLPIDVNERERTGYDVLLWLEEYSDYAPKEIRIHSANGVGRRRMEMAIAKIEGREWVR